MPAFTTSKQKIKPPKSNHSFTTLSQTTTGQSTKKTIQAEQILHYEPQSMKDNKFIFSLPYSVQISDIITQLTNIFSQKIIHVQEDNQGGKILLSGLKNSNKKRYFINFMDCLGIVCLKYGLNGGSLHDSYNIISIGIKKQVIFCQFQILNNRCFISVQNQQLNDDNRSVFMAEIITKIQQQLKKVDVSRDHHLQGPMQTRYLSADSLFLQQIQIKEKIFSIFIYEKDKKWERFRRLYKKSEETIKQKIDQFKLSLSLKQQETGNKKGKHSKSPSALIQSIIFQSESLFRTLLNYYEKQLEEESQLAIFGSLLNSPSQKQMTLYSIQEIISTQYLDEIFSCYLQCAQQQSSLFNKNAKQINDKLSNIKCFDYLELRDRFRLPKLNNPYFPSIQLMKSIPYASCPRQLLLKIQNVFSSVKVDCLKASKGKVQLSSMDDLLPVMIFVTARACVPNFPAYVKMVDDYVRLKNVFQLEQRIITTLYVAVQDITKKWNL